MADVADAVDRGAGTLIGLAAGDAVGLPAMYHRSVRLGSRRDCLWPAAAEADRHRVLRFPLPFTVADSGELRFSGTDDAEMAAAAALMVLSMRDADDRAGMLATFDRLLVDDAGVWCGISEHSAIDNRRRGLVPPATGDFNPHREDDGAVSRCVPVAIRFHREPAAVRIAARSMAEITNSGMGVGAAVAIASGVAVGVGGGNVDEVHAAVVAAIEPASWAGRTLERVQQILRAAGSAFAAIPVCADDIANQTYSHGTIAAETVPLAVTIFRECGGDATVAVPLALMIARQSDSMPAIVGGLCGCVNGVAMLPPQWTQRLDLVRGVTVPAVAGLRLTELAHRLVGAAPAAAHPGQPTHPDHLDHPAAPTGTAGTAGRAGAP
jgi:ADP-ribosylglycohydrolase